MCLKQKSKNISLFLKLIDTIILLQCKSYLISNIEQNHHSQANMITKILFLLAFIIFETHPLNYFCYPTCAKNQCNTDAYNMCRSCLSPYFTRNSTMAPYACVNNNPYTLSNSANYQPVGATPDVTQVFKYNMTLQPINTTATTTTCSGGPPPTVTYTYYGNLTMTSTINFTHPGITNVYFYKIRVLYGLFLIDVWDFNSQVHTNFLNLNVSAPFMTTFGGTGGGANYDSRQLICGNPGSREGHKVITAQWSYSNTDPLNFEVWVSNNTQTTPWGIMHFMVLAKLCHPYCTICTGDSNSVCTACNTAKSAMLSGTTCALTCMTYYGFNSSDPNVCIHCATNCTSCYDSALNCTKCISNHYLYFDGQNTTCINPCPSHTYVSGTTCTTCDANCSNCLSTSTYCTSCNLTYYLYNHVCYNPCPSLTYSINATSTCAKCNAYCLVCSVTSTNCSSCVLSGINQAFLKGTLCTKNCGNTYYPSTNGGVGPNLCLSCDPSCVTCLYNSTFCFSCFAGYYYLNNTCLTSCPFPAYFSNNATWSCLSCSATCVNMTMKIYFQNSLKNTLICDLAFTQALSWNSSDISNFISISQNDPALSLSSFIIDYQPVGNMIMRITLTPKTYIFIYNVTFTFTTKTLNGTYNFATNGYRFSDTDYSVTGSINWFLIKAPSLSTLEQNIINGISGLSDKILQVTTAPYFQELKKSGIFTIFFSGAQDTSTSCLVNTIPAQNFYEGVRLWASFVFFDVPEWEQNSNKTKYVIVPSESSVIANSRLLQYGQQNRTFTERQLDNQLREQIIFKNSFNRVLFNVSKVDWRFQRTGQTSFFIFDMYMNIFLIVLSWISLIIAYKCIQHKIKNKQIVGIMFSFVHKVHQITIFYVALATLLEWMYFDANSFERWLSFSLCLIFNVYFLCYELFVYYDMINYPAARIGNEKYEYFCIRYGSFLKYLRFQEYDQHEQWSMKHWFRPYNYHVLTYYKRFLMMIVLPLFYKIQNMQIYFLIGIQILEIVRFIAVWPYLSKIRNFFRLSLEFFLLFFFVSILIQSYEILIIQQSQTETLQQAINIFYKIGWVGFVMVFLFNIGHFIIFVYDIQVGCRVSNRQLMDKARKFYYMRRLKTYEEENEDVPLNVVNQWVKLGNLNNRKYDELPDINLRIQYFRIVRANQGYQIDLKKLREVFMNIQFNYQKENNISAGQKLNKRFTLTKSLSLTFFSIIDDLYQTHIKEFDFQYMTIKTFQRIAQSSLKPGDKIQLKPELMQQKIQFQTFAGQKRTLKRKELLSGFPISFQQLKRIAA